MDLLELNNKKTDNPIFKMNNEFEFLQMANKHMKRCIVSH